MKSKKLFLLTSIIFLYSFIIAQEFEYDKQLGAQAAVQVQQMIGIYNDSALTTYVNAVGARLVDALGESPVTFQFFVVDMAEPNAFALPGGYIYVSRGLLSLVNDEAELAGVMAHEMIHVTKRHSVKQMKKSILPGLLQIPGAVVGMFNSNLGRIINTPVSLGSELFLSNYSRKQESESDQLGIKLASKAGYDPEKLAVILNHLSEDVKLLTGEAEKKSYFSSHPFTPKRIDNIEKEIPTLVWKAKKAIASDRSSLYTELAGMVYGQNPAQGIFDSTVFKHPDLNLAITFPKEWNIINVPVAVGAIHPEGEAQMVFTIDDSGSTPDSLGQALADRLQKEYNIKPDENKSLNINGYHAWLVSTTDYSGKQPMKVQIYWVQAGDFLFNVMGMSFMNHTETIAGTVKSMRPLNAKEKENIKGLYLRFETVNENETIEAFSKRTNNTWDPATTMLKNGLDETTSLKKEQVLKIAVEEKYIYQ